MTKFLQFLFILVCAIIPNNKCDYDAPKTIEYPFGDEAFNSDITEDRVLEEARDIEIKTIKEIYTFCPNDTEDDDEDALLEVPYNDNQCAKCDIRPTVDKRGVIVECFDCVDVSVMTSAQDENSPSHLLFLTTYVELPNYTLPFQEI